MATSGTIGTTQIKTVSLVEKAVRRCGLPPTSITSETLSIALEDLFTLLMSISNRGLNLWCIDKKLLPLTEGQATYTLPDGSLEVLNLLHATPSRVTGTDSTDPSWFQTQLSEATRVVRVGVKFSVTQASAFNIQSSTDGISWTTRVVVTTPPAAGIWGWYDLDPSIEAQWFRVQAATLSSVSDFFLSTTNREIQVTPFNRDDYANQPNKSFLSDIVTNYFFEKLVDPQITLWPVPGDDTRHLVLFRYRQIQDVGVLTQELELPLRWIEAVIWHLALRLSFELPGVEASRRQELLQMTSSMTFEVEGAETDNAPVYFAPNIRPYTR